MKTPTCVLTVFLLALPPAGHTHHSFFGRFDTSASMELEGVVREIHWRNPHAHFFLELRGEDGALTRWDLESGSPVLMQRAGIPRDAVQVGQRIRVAAYPPLTNKREAFATNILLPDGRELVLQTGANARFSDDTLVAHTTHINWPWFNQRGIPLSSQASIIERFAAIEDGSKMAYEMEITDPVNFTAPVALSKTWIHVPDETILPFECAEYEE